MKKSGPAVGQMKFRTKRCGPAVIGADPMEWAITGCSPVAEGPGTPAGRSDQRIIKKFNRVDRPPARSVEDMMTAAGARGSDLGILSGTSHLRE